MKAQHKRKSITVRASPASDDQMRSHVKNAKAFPASDETRRCVNNMRIATWNIGSLTGRSQELANTLHRRNINICCVQELKWKGSKSRDIGRNYQLLYNGTSTTRNGIGIILDATLKQRIIRVERISDRIMYVKLALDNQPVLNIISVYAPQTGCDKNEKDLFWEGLEDLLQTIPLEERKLVAGDLNGHVGQRAPKDSVIHGDLGYGISNSQGFDIINVATRFNLPIVNTYFRKKDEHLITYKSGSSASQIDFFLCDRAILRYFKDCKVIPGEPLTTQHRLLVACLQIPNWNKKQKYPKFKPRIKWHNMHKPEAEAFAIRVSTYLKDTLKDHKDSNTLWNEFHESCLNTAKTILGITKGKLKIDKDPTWWDDNVKPYLKEKKESFKKWQQTKLESDHQEYKVIKNKAKKCVATMRALANDQYYKQLENAKTDAEIFKLANLRNNRSKDIKRPKYIKSSSGKLLTTDNEITKRWKEYYQALLNEEFPQESLTILPCLEGPVEAISPQEVKVAIQKMKNRKATGPDEIPAELWKSMGDIGVAWLTKLFNEILITTKIPDMWRSSNLIPFYKNKGDVADCGNYRGIKLTSHTLKIWECVLVKRLTKITNITPNQCGFTSGVSTIDAIHSVKILMEKYKARKQDLHLIFIDLEKAFDRVPRGLIWQALRAQLIQEHYVQLIQDLYHNVTTRVVSPAGISKPFEIRVGVHQGSALSPLLFNLVMDYITADIQKPAPWSLLYADDVVLVAESLAEVQADLTSWQESLEKRGLRINRQKTGYMFCDFSGTCPDVIPAPLIEGRPLNRVEDFKYLGSIVAPKVCIESDIQNRIQTAWMKWRSLSGVLCDSRMPIKIKGNVYKRAVRPALLYGSECWPMRKSDEQRVHATEMKMLRWSGGVTRMDKIRNEYVRGTFKVAQIHEKLRENRLRWYGHVMRRDDDHMTKKVLNIEENRRGRGRPPMTWMQTIKNDLKDSSINEQTTHNRTVWRRHTRRADPK